MRDRLALYAAITLKTPVNPIQEFASGAPLMIPVNLKPKTAPFAQPMTETGIGVNAQMVAHGAAIQSFALTKPTNA